MAKYKKKPIIIEADVYKPGMEDGFSSKPEDVETLGDNAPIFPHIETLEGRHWINPGDYIIVGVRGERYPCNPDIFLETYELVEE